MVKLLGILAGVVVILATGFIIFNPNFVAKLEESKTIIEEAVNGYVEPRTTPSPSPERKTLSGGSHIFQTFNNCGPASLSMALSYFGIKVSQKELGDKLRPYQIASGDNDDKSTTFTEMAYLGETYGFTAFVRPNGTPDLIKKFIALDIPVITETWTKPNEDIGHYRVIKGYDDGRGVFIQDDSLQGKNLRYTYDNFNALWEAFGYQYLVLVPKEKLSEAKAIIGADVNEREAWESLLASDTAEFNKLVALYNLGRYEEAVTIYERIKDTLPRRMLWYQIEPILAYQKLGRRDKVFEITDFLIENGNRAFSEVYQIRGEIYEKEGNKEAADAEFAKVYQYNKNFYKYWD